MFSLIVVWEILDPQIWHIHIFDESFHFFILTPLLNILELGKEINLNYFVAKNRFWLVQLKNKNKSSSEQESSSARRGDVSVIHRGSCDLFSAPYMEKYIQTNIFTKQQSDPWALLNMTSLALSAFDLSLQWNIAFVVILYSVINIKRKASQREHLVIDAQ